MAHEVFVSHSSKDKIAADAVVAHLEHAGIPCWVAPRDIVLGSSWATSIVNAINASKIMVVVFSTNANQSDHVHREIERAVSRGVLIVPVRIENVLPHGDLEYFLSSSHWMEAITPPLEKHFDDLASKLRILLAPPSLKYNYDLGNAAKPPMGASTAPSKQTPATKERVARTATPSRLGGRSRGKIVAGVAAALMLAILGAVRLTAQGNPMDKDYRAYQAQLRHGSSNPFFSTYAPLRYNDWRQEADKGNAIAELFVSRCYMQGVGVAKDDSACVKWSMRAADHGNAYAMNNIGWMYDNGNSVPQSHTEAMRWYRKAAEAGNDLGMVNLARSYASSAYGPANYSEALRWYQKAADAGNVQAVQLIGELYEAGHGVPKDLAEATKWYRKAAAAGDSVSAGWLVAERLAPAFTAYAAEGAGDASKTSALATVEKAMPDFEALDLSAMTSVIQNNSISTNVEKLGKDFDANPLLKLYARMVNRYILVFQQATPEARTEDANAFAMVTAPIITKWFDDRKYDEISSYWKASYQDLTIPKMTAGDTSGFITQLNQCMKALFKAGMKKEANQLLQDTLALCDAILTERPWDWYSKESYAGLCFDAAAILTELADTQNVQMLLRRAWTVRLKQHSREDLLTRYTTLPLKGEAPPYASTEDADFFMGFAPGSTSRHDMKRFTIPTDFDGVSFPFYVYVISGPSGYAELQDQFRWVKEIRGGTVSQEVRDSFLRLNEIAVKNKDTTTGKPVDFMELCVYALGKKDSDTEKK